MSTLEETQALVVPPSEDPFYSPVPDLPAAGTLIRSRAVGITHHSVGAAEQLVYVSTGARGQRIAVSGTVLLPSAPWRGPGRRPLVSYGVGVHGLGRDSAPSHLMVQGKEYELEAVAAALDQGWIVLVTDGDGLGMPGPHTYGAGAPGGHAVLDIVRATASAIPAVGGAPVLIWGYSEGGRCAAWAAELQPRYAPDIPLVAVAAGGVPTDLRAVAVSLDDGPFAGLNLAVLIGLAHAHQDPALLRILSEAGRCTAEQASVLDVVDLVVNLPQPLHTHTVRTEPWDDPTWSALLDRERLGRGRPEVPVLVYHVTEDEIVPEHLGHFLAEDYRARGVEVEYRILDAPNHLEGTYSGAAGTVAWLAERLDRRSEHLR